MLSIRSVWIFLVVMLSFATQLIAQSEYQYSYMPKKVYKNQLFPITILAITTKNKEKPSFIFDKSSDIQPLFPTPLEVKNGKNIFYTFYFKAKNINVRIPRLFISSKTRNSSLSGRTILLTPLKEEKDFSAVVAAEMKIKNYQVSNYDGKNHMITLSLEAYEANIEDMSLENINEYGIENLNRKNAKVTAEFYAVLPRTQKELSFSYFNTIKRQYVSLKIPVKVVDASVSTQSDLNPKMDVFEQLKRYTIITFSIFFLLMFLWQKDLFYLVLGVLSIITLLTFYIPHKKICVKQGASLYILPTQTSTVGTQIESMLNTPLLGVHGKFTKVEYKEGIIGWIKDEDICNN